MNILVAEDEAILRTTFLDVLTSAGYSVRVACDGEEALCMLEAELPDVLLLDIMMPKKTGFDVMEVLKEKGLFEKVHVVVLTNLEQETDLEKCRGFGIQDYLVKADQEVEDIIKIVERCSAK